MVRRIPGLETRRLWLRPLTLDDAPRIQALFPQWEIVRELAAVVPWPYPPDGAVSFIRDIALPQMDRGEAWHWTIRQKTEPDLVIGVISLLAERDHNRGFWLGVPWQGRGYMSEAADAVTDYWFDVLGQPILRVPKSAGNAASRRISARQRMRVIATDEREYVSGRKPTELWEITRAEWHAARALRALLPSPQR